MQVAAQDFCVVFIRKKITKTYTWIDPTNRNKRFMQDMHSHCNNYYYDYLKLAAGPSLNYL